MAHQNSESKQEFELLPDSEAAAATTERVVHREPMKYNAFVLLVVGAVCLIIGILMGRYAIAPGINPQQLSRLELLDDLTKDRYSANSDVRKALIEQVDSDRIRSFLRNISSKPHIAGTEAEKELANFVMNTWKQQGLDTAEVYSYTVLLSLPDPNNPNKVELIDGKGNVQFTAESREKNILGAATDIPLAFNSYSPKASIREPAVYVNYGRTEDFDYLESQGISVKGKICIARYGKIFRGNKVRNAENYGAVGMVLFLDPLHVAPNKDEKVFPESWWMPGSAMQRGTLFPDTGDPLTPGYPSRPGVYRMPVNESALPKIPCQPIGYDDAKNILKNFSGKDCPEDWVPLLDIPCFLGDGSSDISLKITVNNELKTIPVNNVIGTIKGSLEPDRYVILGNHRDAWGYGAIDPGSGTCQMLETTRVLGMLHKDGWTPRRTIVFGSWGAEEFGIIGSQEWVEDNLHKIQGRAVAYVNCDICAIGDKFRPASSPSTVNALREAAKLVPHSKIESKTLYDVWSTAEETKLNSAGLPVPKTLGSGTDHAPFAFYAGIPAIDITFEHRYNISGYPPYHTAYETFDIPDKFVDPGFKVHRMCAQLGGTLAHLWSDSTLLPYEFLGLAEQLNNSLELLRESNKEMLQNSNIDLNEIGKAIEQFKFSAKIFMDRLKSTDLKNPMTVRQINDVMMLTERIFILQQGLPERHISFRHSAFAPSGLNSYAASAFPGLADLLFTLDKFRGDAHTKRTELIKKHVSEIAIVISQASEFLNAPKAI